MKKKRFQIWRSVLYQGPKFRYWSNKVEGEGDRYLEKDAPKKEWGKIILLRPVGKPGTVFQVGFSDIYGSTKISSAKIKIVLGTNLFGMRMGPDDCRFFVASNQNQIRLDHNGYTDIEEKLYAPVHLY